MDKILGEEQAKGQKWKPIAVVQFAVNDNVINLNHVMRTGKSSIIDAHNESTKGKEKIWNYVVYKVGDEYVPIDADKTYTICSLNFILLDGGDGVTMFEENEVISKNVMLDSEALIRYIVDVLHGSLKEKYEIVGNRITII